MFRIDALNSEIEAKELSLSDHLFHEALRLQPESKTRFHVKNDKGEDFDIVYWDNEDDIEPTEGYPKYVKPPFIARYPFYDEADTSTLYLEFLHQCWSRAESATQSRIEIANRSQLEIANATANSFP